MPVSERVTIDSHSLGRRRRIQTTRCGGLALVTDEYAPFGGHCSSRRDDVGGSGEDDGFRGAFTVTSRDSSKAGDCLIAATRALGRR